MILLMISLQGLLMPDRLITRGIRACRPAATCINSTANYA